LSLENLIKLSLEALLVLSIYNKYSWRLL